MSSAHEKVLAKFFASCHNLSKASEDLALEDARFVRFTELLQIGNIIDNPTICRYTGGPMNQPWGLLGYSWTEELNGITENIIVGQTIPVGTGSVELIMKTGKKQKKK